MRIALVICLFFASARFCFGAEVRGEVVDTQTGMPLEQVQIRAGDLTVSSDANGDFMVGATSGDSLYFNRVGYEDVVWVVGESDRVIRVEMVADMLRAEEVATERYQRRRGRRDRSNDHLFEVFAIENSPRQRVGDSEDTILP